MNTYINKLDLVELIGADDNVESGEYGASIQAGFDGGFSYQGEFLNFALFSSGGDILTPAGKLLIFSADPGLNAEDTDLDAAADWEDLIGIVPVSADDWVADAVGAVVHKTVAIAFHKTSSIYFAWLHEDATAFNDAGGDDEVLKVAAWLRQEQVEKA